MCRVVSIKQNNTFKNQDRIIYVEKIMILTFALCWIWRYFYPRGHNASKESDAILFIKNLKKAINSTGSRCKKEQRNRKMVKLQNITALIKLINKINYKIK